MVWKSIRLKNVLIIFLSTRYDRYLLKLRREREKEKEKNTIETRGRERKNNQIIKFVVNLLTPHSE